jgi:hypothetical protein
MTVQLDLGRSELLGGGTRPAGGCVSAVPDLEIVGSRCAGRLALDQQIKVDIVSTFQLTTQPEVGTLDVAPAEDQSITIDDHQFVVEPLGNPERVTESKRVESTDRDAFGQKVCLDRLRHLVPLRVNEESYLDTPAYGGTE